MGARRSPKIIVLAGPNGAGKSTAAPRLLRGALGVTEFVNADVIARGLSAFSPERVAVGAGRVMLRRLKELAANRESFAFETTLASRSFAPWLRKLVESGYEFHLVFLWLPNPATAVARVKERVRLGGHGIPAATIRRRYRAGQMKGRCRPFVVTAFMRSRPGYWRFEHAVTMNSSKEDRHDRLATILDE